MLSLLFLKHNHKLGVSLDAAAEQDETPLIDALVKASGSVRAPFFFPGHKMGSGAPRRLLRSLGLRRALRHDQVYACGKLEAATPRALAGRSRRGVGWSALWQTRRSSR